MLVVVVHCVTITTIMSWNPYPISPNYPGINFISPSKALYVVCNLNTIWHLFAPRSARQKAESEPTTIWWKTSGKTGRSNKNS